MVYISRFPSRSETKAIVHGIGSGVGSAVGSVVGAAVIAPEGPDSWADACAPEQPAKMNEKIHKTVAALPRCFIDIFLLFLHNVVAALDSAIYSVIFQ
jgi:hypothetical protein